MVTKDSETDRYGNLKTKQMTMLNISHFLTISSKHRCPVKLKVRATKDGQKLTVKELFETHNHDRNEVSFLKIFVVILADRK